LLSLRDKTSEERIITEIRNDLRLLIRRKEFLFGRIAKHRDQCLIHVEQFSLAITPVDSIGGIVLERPIQRLRMPQCFFCLCQFFPQLLVIQRPTNHHRQVSDIFSFNVLERALSCQFHDRFAPRSGRQKNNGDLLEGLMKQLQYLRSLAM
jgi:hypothetical protein